MKGSFGCLILGSSLLGACYGALAESIPGSFYGQRRALLILIWGSFMADEGLLFMVLQGSFAADEGLFEDSFGAHLRLR